MKRMTDERVRADRIEASGAMDLDCDCPPGAHEADCFEGGAERALNRLEADHDRARAREARLEAVVESAVRGYAQGYKLTPAEVAAMKAALEAE
jgi:hypothetical protein